MCNGLRIMTGRRAGTNSRLAFANIWDFLRGVGIIINLFAVVEAANRPNSSLR